MGRMNDKQVTIITAAAMALLAIGLGAATYFFFAENNKKAKEELDGKKSDLLALERKEKELNDWKKALPDLLKQDEERVDVLPSKEERKPQVFHDAVYALARESNAIIRSAQEVASKAAGPGRPVGAAAAGATGPWEKVSYKYRVEGEFYHVAAFLSRIEGMKRFVRVVTVRLAPSQRTLLLAGSQKLVKTYANLDMEVNFYFLK